MSVWSGLIVSRRFEIGPSPMDIARPCRLIAEMVMETANLKTADGSHVLKTARTDVPGLGIEAVLARTCARPVSLVFAGSLARR